MLTYRQMRPEDVDAALNVRFSTLENAITLQELEHDYGVTPQSIAEALGSISRGWLCEDGSKVVGFSIGDGLSGEVKVVAVSPGYEGQGIGKTVLANVKSWLFALGHQEIWLLANPDPNIRASGFYRKLGWEATGEMNGQDEILKLQREK